MWFVEIYPFPLKSISAFDLMSNVDLSLNAICTWIDLWAVHKFERISSRVWLTDLKYNF